MFLYNPRYYPIGCCIGKTLAEIRRDCRGNIGGYSIFILQDENDKTGKPLDEDFSIGMILKKYPEYANYVVKYENDFYGTTVLRAVKEL